MRRTFSFLVKIGITVFLLYLALKGVDVSTVVSRLSRIDTRWIALGLLIPVLQNVLSASRWQQVIRACGGELPFRQLFHFTMVALFFNQTLPSSIGGDAVRIWLVGKQSNWRVASYSVFIDRVVGVVALAILVTVCLPWTLSLVRNPVGRSALLLIGLGSIVAGVVFIALAWEGLQILQRWTPTRHLAATAVVLLQIVRSPPALGVIFGLSFLIHFLSAVIAWCAARAVGANLPLLYSLFLVLPVVLIAVVPISVAGWGIREGAMIAAFGYAGLPTSDGLVISLLFGASYLATGIVGGLLWVLTGERLNRQILRETNGETPRICDAGGASD